MFYILDNPQIIGKLTQLLLLIRKPNLHYKEEYAFVYIISGARSSSVRRAHV